MLVAQAQQKPSQGRIIQYGYLPGWVYLEAAQVYA